MTGFRRKSIFAPPAPRVVTIECGPPPLTALLRRGEGWGEGQPHGRAPVVADNPPPGTIRNAALPLIASGNVGEREVREGPTGDFLPIPKALRSAEKKLSGGDEIW